MTRLRLFALWVALAPALGWAEEATPAEPDTAVTPEPAREATPDSSATPSDRPGLGVWTGDEYRYGRKWGLVDGVVIRSLMDLVAIPSGLGGWDLLDWSVAAATIASTVALSLPLGPSLDVRIQRGLQATLGPDHFRIWAVYGDMVIWFGIWGSVASLFLYGITTQAPELVEASALAVEAFAIAQAYHLVIKLFTGRENPNDAVTPGETTGEGRYFGPSGFSRLFPSGTPSGHVITMYAIFSVLMHSFDTPAVWVTLNTLALVFSLTIIADNYHWASDVILGAALGFCIGRWVVHHRSSHYRNDEGGLPRRVIAAVAEHVTLVPTVLPQGGFGGAVLVRF